MNVNVNVKRKKNPGRKRRVTGWTLLLLGLLVAGVWVWSGWWNWSGWMGRLWGRIGSGELRLCFDPRPEPVFNGLERQPQQWLFWYGTQVEPFYSRQYGLVRTVHHSYNDTTVELLLWPIPLLLCAPAAILLRSATLARRRAITNACPKCGYSLAGLPPGVDAKCPECGKEAT